MGEKRARYVVGLAIAALALALAVWRFAGSHTFINAPSLTPKAGPSAVHPTSPVVEADQNASPRWFVRSKEAAIEFSGTAFVEGAPRAGVGLRLVDEIGAMPEQRTKSDAAGHFSFVGVVPIRGSYRIEAVAEESLTTAWQIVGGDASKSGIELHLAACAYAVYGTVFDASGGAVVGASVFFETAPTRVVRTDAKGAYRLCTALVSARLRVVADGYGAWGKSVSPRGSIREDVTLMPVASLEGKVLLSGTEKPVPFALVKLTAAWEKVNETEADEAGNFRFERISPGAYTLEGRAPFAKSKQPLNVAVFASGATKVSLLLDSRTRVSGRVIAKGNPVRGAFVSLGFWGTHEWSSRAKTKEDGTFAIEDAPIGPTYVAVDTYDVESPKSLRVPTTGLTNVEINVATKEELRATVLRKGTPVKNAVVYVRSTIASDSARTGANGIASVNGLAAGAYRVVAEEGNDFSVKEGVAVTLGETSSVTLELEGGRQIEGTVVDENGASIDGARVSFVLVGSTEDTGASAITGADGAFRGGPLRGPAVYRAKVTRSESILEPKTAFPEIAVPAEGRATPSPLALVVRASDKSLRGTVVDPSGGPVVDARVTASGPQRHSEILATTFTGADGSFALGKLGSGPFSIRATSAAGAEVELKPVTLPSPPIVLKMPNTGSVRGTLRGFTSSPSVMAWKTVGYDPEDLHYAVIEGNSFTIEGLSFGTYHIAASTPTGAATASVVVDRETPITVNLVASAARTIRARTVDLATGKPLAGMNCVLAPLIEEARSPVMVPGNAYSDADGNVEFRDAPASDLYGWCMGNEKTRGGVARFPADLGNTVKIVWGLDVTGKPPINASSLGFEGSTDFPLSRRIDIVDPKGAAARCGLLVGDEIEQVGDKSMADVNHGLIRVYLATLLTEQKTVPIVVRRGNELVPIAFRLP